MELNNIKKILIVNLGGIGDLLLSFPAIKPLKEKYVGCSFDAFVVERAVGLSRDFKVFDNVFAYRPGIFAMLKLFVRLRNNHYDLVINMRTMVSRLGALKMYGVFKIINGRISAGRDTQKRGFFLDIKIPETEPGEKYEMEYDIDTVRALGVEVRDKRIDFSPGLKSEREVNGVLQDHGINADDILVGIHPGGMPSRRWPLENFLEVIKKTAEVRPVKFVVTGSVSESNLAQALVKAQGANIIDMTGRFDVQQMFALIKRCDLFISNDTGPMHIAAILKTPLIAIFGPGQLIRFDPRVISDKAVVLYKKSDCAPCNKEECRSMKCLKAIAPDEVVKIVLELLNRKKCGG